MIKVNLLESVTDRTTGVAFVEDKVSSTRTQTFLLVLTVVALLVLGIGYDYVSANAQHQAATKELEKQRRINDQMNSVKREQAVPGLYLKSVEQKDAELTIKGESPTEAAVTRFGQSMEFSSGLFTNLNIETQREVPQASKTSAAPAQAANPLQSLLAQPEVVSFTIKCAYAAAKPPDTSKGSASAPNTTNHVTARN